MSLEQGGQGPIWYPFTLIRVRVTAEWTVSVHWVPVEVGEPPPWTSGLGRCHRLPRVCFKRPVWMGLFLALVSRHVFVTQMLLAVGQRRERQTGSRHRKRRNTSCWVF